MGVASSSLFDSNSNSDLTSTSMSTSSNSSNLDARLELKTRIRTNNRQNKKNDENRSRLSPHRSTFHDMIFYDSSLPAHHLQHQHTARSSSCVTNSCQWTLGEVGDGRSGQVQSIEVLLGELLKHVICACSDLFHRRGRQYSDPCTRFGT